MARCYPSSEALINGQLLAKTRKAVDSSSYYHIAIDYRAQLKTSALAAELDFVFNRCLQPQELTEMAATAGLIGPQRRSFIQADLVILTDGPGS